MSQNKINIVNKQAKFEFELLETYQAGIMLTGTEIKSIRANKASIREAFCEFSENNNDLFIINMNIDPYENGGYCNHSPKRKRKLLLNKSELQKLRKEVTTKGNTIVPLKVFLNDRGLAKMKIALAKGKKLFDKRNTIKDRENKINMDRLMKTHRNH